MAQVVWTLRGRINVVPQLADVAPLATVSTSFGNAAPLAGVKVQVSAKQFGADPTWDEWGETTTDADGNFEVRHTKNETKRLFRVRVQFKSDRLRIYPPNDSLLKKFVDVASLLVPGGVLTSLATAAAQEALEQLLEQSTRVLYDVKWITARQDSDGDKRSGPVVDFGNVNFRAGGSQELGGFTERRHAEIWLVASRGMNLIEGLGDFGFRGDRSVAFLYPHENPVIGDGIESSYCNPHNDIVYLVRNSQIDHFNVDTILHELVHLWAYQHTSGEEKLATYLLVHGSTHTGRVARWVAWHEAFAEAVSNEITRQLLGTRSTVYRAFTAERRPLSRPYLNGLGIRTLADVDQFEFGWLSAFGLLLCPDVCSLDMTGSGPYATDTTPGVQPTGFTMCRAPKFTLGDLLRVVAHAPDGKDGGLDKTEMTLGLFLRRCVDVVAKFTSTHADAYLKILDPAETRQPSELLRMSPTPAPIDPGRVDLNRPVIR